MSKEIFQPRILLISQWPNVKNGEYELIEKIKQTGYKITVVDYFGFNVDTGECINRAELNNDYDYAISFHYDTPKFINIPTYLWVANPLEFMHLRGDYRNVLIHHLRSYDDYLYNGSNTLKSHIKNVVGKKWRDTGLDMFAACSSKVLHQPQKAIDKNSSTAHKLFYCGVNWERGSDSTGRAQGLLDILQEKKIADFYGPNKLGSISPWDGFISYKGEIPFDGISISRTMSDYGAVLAVSSPAHMKSHTSSSRVFEGIAAGVPVISDENPHVRHLFGDLVYYFRGNSEDERAESINQALNHIIEFPNDAVERVVKAQKLMVSQYCFEVCFERLLKHNNQTKEAESKTARKDPEQIDIFLFHHDLDPLAFGDSHAFQNASFVVSAATFVAESRKARVRIICCAENIPAEFSHDKLIDGLSIVSFKPEEITNFDWNKLRLGEKISILSKKSDAELITFFTQLDFPHYDYFAKSASWFAEKPNERENGIYVAGFFINDLTQKAPHSTTGTLRNNIPDSMYRWSQNSLAEHQLASLTFGRGALALLGNDQVSRFDSILTVAVIASAISNDLPVHRSRHILVRVQYGYFHRHYEAYARAAAKGFWSQQYDLVTNYNHELNALYDLLHESQIGVAIADQVSGHALSQIVPVDPAVHVVNRFINRLRPWYRMLKKTKRFFLIR
jgi:hypothetical protein